DQSKRTPARWQKTNRPRRQAVIQRRRRCRTQPSFSAAAQPRSATLGRRQPTRTSTLKDAGPRAGMGRISTHRNRRYWISLRRRRYIPQPRGRRTRRTLGREPRRTRSYFRKIKTPTGFHTARQPWVEPRWGSMRLRCDSPTQGARLRRDPGLWDGTPLAFVLVMVGSRSHRNRRDWISL